MKLQNTSDSSTESNWAYHPFNSCESVQGDPPATDLLPPIGDNHTKIDLSDHNPDYSNCDRPKSKFERFQLLNRGIYNGKWADQEMKRNQDDWYLCQSIASQLGLSDSLADRVFKSFCSLDARTFKKYKNCTTGNDQRDGTSRDYLVVFCLCILYHNKYCDDPDLHYYPKREVPSRMKLGIRCRSASSLTDEVPVDCNELMQKFTTRLNFEQSQIKSCIEKVRGKCTAF